MITPVLLLIFNRPDKTALVFAEIRKAQVPVLYIAADGPRPEVSGEVDLCEQTRAEVLDNIDWPCELKTMLRTENLGCRSAVSSAIDWFFSEVEEGIILEDDCLPHPDFFRFCGKMLDFYRDNPAIMHICGSNFQLGCKRGAGSYYFSHYAHVWGWATWRRAWELYDVKMNKYPGFVKSNAIASIFPGKKEQKRWLELLNYVYTRNKHFNTWDFQWNFALWFSHGLAIIPNCNLISNIGENGTHYNTVQYMFQKLENMDKKITHPRAIVADIEADSLTFKNFFDENVLISIMRKIKNVIYNMRIMRFKPASNRHLNI